MAARSTEGGGVMTAQPEEMVQALVNQGFHEYKRERARLSPHHEAGGLWLGLDERTGAVASVIWVSQDGSQSPLVFVDVERRDTGAAA